MSAHKDILQRALPSRDWATRAQGQGIPDPRLQQLLRAKALPQRLSHSLSWAWGALVPWAALLLSGAERWAQSVRLCHQCPLALLVPSPSELLIPAVPAETTVNKPQSSICRLQSSPLSYTYYSSSVCFAIKMKQIPTKETKNKVVGEQMKASLNNF